MDEPKKILVVTSSVDAYLASVFSELNCEYIVMFMEDEGLFEYIEKTDMLVVYLEVINNNIKQKLRKIKDVSPDKPIVLTTTNSDQAILKWSLRNGIFDCVKLPEELMYFRSLLKSIRSGTSQKNITRANIGLGESKLPQNTSTTARLTPAIKYIEENYNKKISIALLAKLCNMSSSNFTLKFKKEKGVSFRSYINLYRISIAKEWLLTTDMTAKQIAHQLGFDDVSHFSRRFKSIEKLPPMKYRSTISNERVAS